MAKTPLIYYRAYLETAHFSFEAYDVTADAARRAMVRAIKRHCAQYNALPAPMLADYRDDITVSEIRIGRAYRDYSVI